MSEFILITKEGCPYCVKAKDLLDELGNKYESFEVENIDQMNKLLSGYIVDIPIKANTVPQILEKGRDGHYSYIGGYSEILVHLCKKDVEPKMECTDGVCSLPEPKPKKTVFNTENRGHISGDYPLFLGENLGFKDTIVQPYPILDTLYQQQMAQIWNEFEIDLTQDGQDMLTAPRQTVDLMVYTIMYQMLADSAASRSISGVLMDYVTNGDLEDLYNAIALFETIHARTYIHIVKQTFVDPVQALEEGYKNTQVINRGKAFTRAFDALLDTPYDAPIREKRKALYQALVALYILESLNFMASFAITFGVAETGIFQGIAQNVKLICRDEMLHAKAGAEILKIEMARHPEIFAEIKPIIQEMYSDAVRIENEWTDYLFSEGRQAVGINPSLIKKYVTYAATPVANLLKLEGERLYENPLPYMDTYIDSSKTQVANQEMQNGTYLVNAVLPLKNKEEFLAKMRMKYSAAI